MRLTRVISVPRLAMWPRVCGILLLIAALLVGCVPREASTTPGESATPLATLELSPQATFTLVPPETPTQVTGGSPSFRRPPAGTIALYAVGAQDDLESLDLYALGADGSATALGGQVPWHSVASHDGRWVVQFDALGPSRRTLLIQSLDDAQSYTIPLGNVCTEGDCLAGLWAFDRGDARLASVEVVTIDHWALTIISLQDGSIRRFDALQPESEGHLMKPGRPLGWAATGELVLDTITFSGGWGGGVWALRLPDEGPPLSAEVHARRLLAAGSYSSKVTLSPDGVRLHYLARDPAYTPVAREGWDMDTAVNQLWSLDIASGKASKLTEVADGGALAWPVAWSPDGRELLFAQGRYDETHGGWQLDSLVLQAVDAAGAVRELAPLAAQGAELIDLYWCRPDLGLALVYGGNGLRDLYMVDLTTGQATSVARGEWIEVLAVVPDGA